MEVHRLPCAPRVSDCLLDQLALHCHQNRERSAAAAGAAWSASDSSHPAASTTPSGSASNPSSPDPFPYFAPFSKRSQPLESHTWMRDLELMHHWTAHASLTLTTRPEISDIWQNIVPREAMAFPFLMHHVLTYAALHLAYTKPDQSRAFYVLSTHHHERAIASFREALARRTPDDRNAVFAAAQLVTVNAFATVAIDPAVSDDLIEELLNIIGLMQGCIQMWIRHMAEGALGVFQPLLVDSFVAAPPSLLPHLVPRLDALEDGLRQHADVAADVRAESLHAAATLRAIIGYYVTCRCDSRALRVTFRWPNTLPLAFQALLRARHPAALAVLAHYCVVVHAAAARYWFLEGWAEHVSIAIADAVGPDWRPLIDWALGYIATEPGEG